MFHHDLIRINSEVVKAFRPGIPPKQTLGAPDISVVLFVMLYHVVLTFESVDQILTCDHPNESYFCEKYIPGEMSCGAV